MSKPSQIRMAVLCVLAVCLIVTIISLSTSYWSQEEYTVGLNTYKRHYGLWSACSCSKDKCECFSFEGAGEEVKDYYKVCEATMILSLMGVAAALIIQGVVKIKESQTRILKVITIILLVTAVILDIIAVTVFAVKQKGDINKLETETVINLKFSWSWGLAIVAGVLELIAIGLVIPSSTHHHLQYENEPAVTTNMLETNQN